MSSKAFTKWIDRRNYEACLGIAQTYYGNKERGKTIPVYKAAFLVLLIQRIFLVFLSLFRFNRNPYINYKNKGFGDIIKRLIGVNKFEITDLLPLRSSFYSFSFPICNHPTVSIIVCVHNNIAYTYNCLLSILENTLDVGYEVILVNDCSNDETANVLSLIENLVVLHNKENLGFLRSCNKAMSYAKGKYVCFLNNDVQVRPDWLRNLIAPYENFKNVGLVGAKLVYPYGLLQEAGGIVNYKGEPANYGKFEDPNNIYYNYIRQTDYCSGACILLLKQDLIELNGFNELFSPAYYEDTDLAFRVRYWLKKRVYYQPLSTVVHFEGISSGKVSDGSNVKSFQDVNAAKFLERWQSIFKTFPTTTEYILNARKFVQGNNVIIIEPLLPTFDQDSGSRRIFELVKLLLQLNYNVIFLANERSEDEFYYCKLVNIGVWILYGDVLEESDRDYLRHLAPFIDLAWICRPHMNKKYGKLIKELGIKWINDTVDLHFLREERELSLVGGNEKEAVERVEKHKKEELMLIKQADVAIAITPVEADILNSYGVKHVFVVPNIHHSPRQNFPSFHDRQHICFIGGYRHTPNIDAAFWLINEIMPLVWVKRPEIKVYLLGSHPPKEVIDLQSENVIVPGYIQDVSSYFLSSRVFAAPLRFGAGMKGKIGQSFEYGLPVVTTSIGAEGMGLTVGENYLCAEETDSFAEALLMLYQDEDLWYKLSKGGSKMLEQYRPERIIKELEKILTH